MGKFDRNKCFLIGALLVMLGLQLRAVERFTLSQPATEVLAKVTNPDAAEAAGTIERLMPAVGPTIPRKVITPPAWLGLALISVGAVFSLHSFAMQKPA